MTHMAPLLENATAMDVAKVFRHEIFKYHGMPRNLVSDRDAKFTSEFWKELFRLLGPKAHMSTAYHPQSDGQTENMNRTLEDMLRHWITPSLDNWDELLDCAEFAINNAYNASIKDTPFRMNSGQNPLTPLGMVADTHVPAAQDFADGMRASLKSAQKAMLEAQQRQKQSYDSGHRHQEFEVGDQVLVRTKNIKFKGATAKKLMPKWVGPMKVAERIGALAYRLELPSTLTIYPVFHTGLLKPYYPGTRDQGQPLRLMNEDIDEFEVHQILKDRATARVGVKSSNKRSVNRRSLVEYLVQWKGQGLSITRGSLSQEWTRLRDRLQTIGNAWASEAQ